MPGTIRLETSNLEEKISRLLKIQSALENNGKISALTFGGEAPAEECKGCAADGMRQMNRELDDCATKFSNLINATVQYLQNVKTTFEEADAALGGS